MIKRIKNIILDIISKNQVTWLWNQQNIDIFDVFLLDFSQRVINYKADDCLLNDYTKLISFFNANIEECTRDVDLSDIISNPKKNIFNIITAIFNSIIHKKYRKIKRQFSNYHFTNQEINLMTKIYKSNSKSDPKVIIINNLNLANEIDSLFIMKMIESGFLKIYAPNIKLVIISSSNCLNGLELSKINSKNYYEVIVLQDELCDYISKKYNIKNISHERIKQYLRLCNNDLNLIAIIADTTKDSAFDFSNYEYEITLEHIIRNILEKTPGLNALEIAAVIGLSFDIATINEISDYPTNELVIQLNDAYNRGLLIKPENQKYNFSFISELIRTIIYDSGNIDNQWHLKYAEKLGRTLPYEFALIAKHYYLGNELEKSIVNYIAYFIICVIDNKPINNNDVIISKIQNCINTNIAISAAFNQIKKYLEDYRNHNVTSETLNIYTNSSCLYIDRLLIFTKSVVIYHGKFSKSESDFENLANCLEDIYTYLEQIKCTGLQIRCGLYLIDIYSYRINKLESALKVKQKLDSLTNYILLSPNIENQNLRITLRRKTSSLLSPELANERTKSLLLECIESHYCLDDVEIYKLTSDYFGYALYSGMYNDIPKSIIQKAEEYLKLGEEFNYPKLYKLQMNYLIYKIFTNKMPDSELEMWITNQESTSKISSSMYNFDLAAIAILCGHLNYAELILLKLYQELDKNNTCFYNYCYCANLATLYLLKKDYNKAKYYNDFIICRDYTWEKDFIEIMKYRAARMNKFIEMRLEFTSKSLYKCFDSTPIFSSSVWRFLGKGILFSELMFYRE